MPRRPHHVYLEGKRRKKTTGKPAQFSHLGPQPRQKGNGKKATAATKKKKMRGMTRRENPQKSRIVAIQGAALRGPEEVRIKALLELLAIKPNRRATETFVQTIRTDPSVRAQMAAAHGLAKSRSKIGKFALRTAAAKRGRWTKRPIRK